MALTADQRRAHYLRDSRTQLTPAQARRVRKHEHREAATIAPKDRRAGRRWVTATDRARRTQIRAWFRLRRGH